MLGRDMNLVVGTHIEVGGIVARQHHGCISAQELHLAVVADSLL